MMASSAAFVIVKLAGAAYLLFSGIQMLLGPANPESADIVVEAHRENPKVLAVESAGHHSPLMPIELDSM